MKKFLLLALLLAITCRVKAQDYKLLIDDNGRSTDFSKATSYIIVKRLTDTAWTMQQYDMENVILQSGTFKDRNLQTPNGKFTYYRKLDFYNNKQMKEWLKSDTTNCIMSEGEFKNGKKNGRWTDYFIGGKKREEAYYKDGVLNGPYYSSNDDHSTLALSGNYSDGKREGDWRMYNLHGEVIETDRYHAGKVRSRKMSLGPYNASKPPPGFETYVSKAFRKIPMAGNLRDTTIKYSLTCTVTKDGKVLKPELLSPWHNDKAFVKAILDIIEASPQWTPANIGDETKPVDDFAVISIEINNGGITTKVLDYGQVKATFFNLTH